MEQAMQPKVPDGVPHDGNRLDALLLASAFALLNAAQWLTRVVLSSPFSQNIDYALRVFSVVLFLAVALLARNREVDIGRISLASLGTFLVVPLISLATRLVSSASEEFIVLDCMRQGAASLGSVLCLCALTVAFARYRGAGPRAVVGAWLGAQVLFFACSYAPVGCLEAVRPILRIGAAAFLCAFLYRRRRVGAVPDAQPHAIPKAPPAQRAGMPLETMPLLATTALLPFLFCVVSQFLGITGFEDSLYEPSSEIGAIGLLAFLFACAPAVARRLDSGLAVAACIPLYAAGYMLLPVELGPGTLLSRLFIKLGFAAFQVFAFALLLKQIRSDPRQALMHAALFWGVFKASKIAGRGLILYTPALQEADAWLIAVGGLFALSLLGALLFAWSSMAYRAPQATPMPDSSPTEPPATRMPSEPAQVSETPSPVAHFAVLHGLSGREGDVLSCVVRGYGVKEIADSLSVSQGTVKTHLHNMYRKCGVSDKQQLIHQFEQQAFSVGRVTAENPQAAPAAAQ